MSSVFQSVMCGLYGENSDKSEFGHKVKSKFFQPRGFTNFNSGSFGCVARDVKEAHDALFEVSEEHPDRWFRETYYKHIEQSRVEVASLINGRLEDVVLVENASAAVNCVLRSLALKRGDKVLVLSTTYRMVSEVLDWLVATQGIEIVHVAVQFPIEGKKQVLDDVSAALESHDNIKMCIFCHITSMPTVILPCEELVGLVRASDRNSAALVFIDGAHAPGSIDINVESMSADYYTGNLHKWCYAPKGCAFLWTRSSQQNYDILQPTVIGATGKHGYADRFAYTGTRDYTNFAAITAAFAFCRSLGGSAAIGAYNHDLAIQGARICVKKWGTQLLVPENMLGPMSNVVLPCSDEVRCKALTDALQSKYNTFLIARDWKLSDGTTVWFTRLSGQVYLELEDFDLLATRVLELLAETGPV